MLRMLSAAGDAGDVFFFISYTGRTKTIVEAAQLAQATDATVIALTAEDSPLAKVSDCTIGVTVAENTDDYLPMTSRIVHLVTLDALVTGVTILRGDAFVDHLARLKASLRDTRLT